MNLVDLLKKYNYDTENNSPTLLKQQEIFYKFIDDGFDQRKIHYDDLTYHFKGKNIREKKDLDILIMHSFFKKR